MKRRIVTICLLVYKNAEELEPTIAALERQVFQGFDAEIIISDDGSKNYDTKILEEYAARLRKKYFEVRVNVNEENVGTVKHLNKVFRMAKGAILIPHSSGDAFSRESSLATLVEKMEKSGKRIFTTRRLDLYPDGKKKKRPSIYTGVWMKYFPNSFLRSMICKRNVLSGCCTIYRKDLLEEQGYFDEEYHLVEDYPFYTELLLQKESFGWCRDVIFCHRIGGVSTGKIHPSIYKDIERMREKLLKRSDLDKKTARFLEQNRTEREG